MEGEIGVELAEHFRPNSMVTASDDRLLVLTRHGESEWNKLNLFTGWKDPDLTELGVQEAGKAAQRIKAKNLGLFDIAYTSDLKRAQRTCQIMLDGIGQSDLQVIKSEKLNERDYGALSGLNKDDARKKWGEDQVHIWRRSYDVPPPEGESLKMTAERVLPYWHEEIKPRIIKGDKVFIAAHGNSMRALIMELEGLSGEEIVGRELATGVPIVYKLNSKGEYISKEVLNSTE